MTFNEFKTIIAEKFPEVTPLQMEQFEKMDALYRDWNSKINVVSRKDMDELYRHHVLHSLGIAAYLKTQMPDIYDHLRGKGPYSLAEPLKILDLGTGGGFPGIPLAVIFPHAKFTLCDSIGKKIIVATEVSKGLELRNNVSLGHILPVESVRFHYCFVILLMSTAKLVWHCYFIIQVSKRAVRIETTCIKNSLSCLFYFRFLGLCWRWPWEVIVHDVL